MKALCWHGKGNVRVENVAEPSILHAQDIILRVTATAICGSDLHIFNGRIPTMEAGDILGHEFMGEVVEKGKDVKNLKIGDKVVVPFTIACGNCFFCQRHLFALCDNSNPNAHIAKKMMGHAAAGIFGYSHMTGGFSGGQAEYVRVPFADVGPIKIPPSLGDEKFLFLSDILPTGYMAAENCNIEPADTIAIWGAGPVGQFALESAWLLGAARVIMIDNIEARLSMAKKIKNTEIIHADKENVYEALMTLTKGRGPDKCIDAVGMEAHSSHTLLNAIDKIKSCLHIPGDQPYVLNEMIKCCRKGGTLSIPGVYISKASLLFGAAMNKGLTFKMGQTHVQHYMSLLLEHIINNRINTTYFITHRLKLCDAEKGYKMFCDHKNECIKVVMTP